MADNSLYKFSYFKKTDSIGLERANAIIMAPDFDTAQERVSERDDFARYPNTILREYETADPTVGF